MDNNKLKLPDDWAKDYESPVTLQIRKIAEQIEEQRENQITATIFEQMGVNVDKNELKRALAYDRDQYRRGYEDGWRARSKDVPQWIPIRMASMTEEEKTKLFIKYGEDAVHEDMKIFVSPMPEDGQEILISTPWGVMKDNVEYDDYGGIGLEEHGDFDNVLAWMPLPEPYKEDDDDALSI